jgi:hypothetical protein
MPAHHENSLRSTTDTTARTCAAPCTSMSSTQCLPAALTWATAARLVPYLQQHAACTAAVNSNTPNQQSSALDTQTAGELQHCVQPMPWPFRPQHMHIYTCHPTCLAMNHCVANPFTAAPWASAPTLQHGLRWLRCATCLLTACIAI